MPMFHDGALGREEKWLRGLDENDYREGFKRFDPFREPLRKIPANMDALRERLKADLTEEAAEVGQTYEEFMYYQSMRHIPWNWVPKYKGPKLETKPAAAE